MTLYWLAFGPAKTQHWWNRFLHPDYQHCVLIKWDGFEFFLIHGGMAGIAVDVVHDPVGHIEGMHSYTLVSRETVDEEKLRLPLVFAPFTCVEVAKAILGIRSPLLLTPHQLYHWAIQHSR